MPYPEVRLKPFIIPRCDNQPISHRHTRLFMSVHFGQQHTRRTQYLCGLTNPPVHLSQCGALLS